MPVSLIPLASAVTGTLPDANAPIGGVIQVVYGSTTTQVEASFASATDLGLSASITPSSSSSKILVLVSANGLGSRSTSTIWNGYLVRNSTNIGAFINYAGDGTGGAGWWGASLCVLDSPATTSSTTYKLQGIRASGSASCIFNVSTGTAGTGTISTITLLEIAA
jgi:hypothetical protein